MSLSLKPNTLPADALFPDSPQRLLNWIAQNLLLKGSGDTISLVTGATIPEAANRDKLWLKQDSLGHPVGLYYYLGGWKPVASYMSFGDSDGRPTYPEQGQTYWDTDIGAALIYFGSTWRTLEGVSGDVKLVRAASSAAALTANPGWVLDEDYASHTGATLSADMVALKKA